MLAVCEEFVNSDVLVVFVEFRISETSEIHTQSHFRRNGSRPHTIEQAGTAGPGGPDKEARCLSWAIATSDIGLTKLSVGRTSVSPAACSAAERETEARSCGGRPGGSPWTKSVGSAAHVVPVAPIMLTTCLARPPLGVRTCLSAIHGFDADLGIAADHVVAAADGVAAPRRMRPPQPAGIAGAHEVSSAYGAACTHQQSQPMAPPSCMRSMQVAGSGGRRGKRVVGTHGVVHGVAGAHQVGGLWRRRCEVATAHQVARGHRVAGGRRRDCGIAALYRRFPPLPPSTAAPALARPSGCCAWSRSGVRAPRILWPRAGGLSPPRGPPCRSPGSVPS